ncbi:hypothetical protein [Streptomyces prunicolor]|uniref:hypothetical protein n=1 Tax=Streptomyces prunicolor TaxID=67348 RepID=UPI0033C61D42
MTITSLAFLTPGNFADDAPYIGLEETIQLFVYGEELGYDGAWIRQHPARDFDLSKVKCVATTGSPLPRRATGPTRPRTTPLRTTPPPAG